MLHLSEFLDDWSSLLLRYDVKKPNLQCAYVDFGPYRFGPDHCIWICTHSFLWSFAPNLQLKTTFDPLTIFHLEMETLTFLS